MYCCSARVAWCCCLLLLAVAYCCCLCLARHRQCVRACSVVCLYNRSVVLLAVVASTTHTDRQHKIQRHHDAHMKDPRICIHVNVNVCEVCFILRLPGLHGIREPRDIGRTYRPQCPQGSGAHPCKPKARTHANPRPHFTANQPNHTVNIRNIPPKVLWSSLA